MFKDWNEVADWAKSAVEEAVNLGLMKGYPDGTFRPDQPIRRDEFAVAIINVVHMIRELLDYDTMNTLRKVANFIVQVDTPTGKGSGVLINGSRVLTNAHVVENHAQVSVYWTSPFADDTVPKGRHVVPVIRKHEKFDLAMIDVSSITNIPGAEFADEWADTDFSAVDKKFHGQSLFTVGSPMGIGGTISEGKFSGIDVFGLDFFLTFSGGINPGNSGGGIFNNDGKLVSICVAKPIINKNTNAVSDDLSFGVLPLAVKRFIDGQL